MRFRSFLLCGQIAGLLTLIVVAFCIDVAAPEPIAFKNVTEFKAFAISKGLLFHCGNISGVACGNNFFVADHPIVEDDLEGICTRRDCGLTPAWRGVLWASQLGNLGLRPEYVGGTWRVWGKVLVAGDEDLMDRIEDLYQSK